MTTTYKTADINKAVNAARELSLRYIGGFEVRQVSASEFAVFGPWDNSSTRPGMRVAMFSSGQSNS